MGKQEGSGSNAPVVGAELRLECGLLSKREAEGAGVDKGRWGTVMANACVEGLF